MQSPILQDRDTLFIPQFSWDNVRSGTGQMWNSDDYSVTMPAAWNTVHEREVFCPINAQQTIAAASGFRTAALGVYMKSPEPQYATEYELYAYDVVLATAHVSGSGSGLTHAEFWVGPATPGGNGAVVDPDAISVIDAGDPRNGLDDLPTLRTKGVIAIAPPDSNRGKALVFGVALIANGAIAQIVQVQGHLAVQRLTMAPPRTLDRRRS